MHGNVNSPLGLEDSGHTVDAQGWMLWDTGETSAVFTIGITQGTVSGTGSGTYQRGRTTWDIPVTAGNGADFHEGQATASVTAVVSNGGAPPTTVNWTAPVQLDD
jgi:hypothetical protein